MKLFKKVLPFALVTGLAIGTFSAYAAWDDTKQDGDSFVAAEYNELVRYVKQWIFNPSGDTILADANAKVGIGTASPMVELDVHGSIHGTTEVRGGQLCIGDDCRAEWPSGTGGDNLGNHVATQDLDMNQNNVNNIESLNANNEVRGGQLCIGDDCRDAWPEGAGTGVFEWNDTRGEGDFGESCEEWLTRTGQLGDIRYIEDTTIVKGECTYAIRDADNCLHSSSSSSNQDTKPVSLCVYTNGVGTYYNKTQVYQEIFRGGDNLGNHVATQDLNMKEFNIEFEGDTNDTKNFLLSYGKNPDEGNLLEFSSMNKGDVGIPTPSVSFNMDAPANSLVVAENGNVGIGGFLDVNGNINTGGTISSLSTENYNTIQMDNDGNSKSAGIYYGGNNDEHILSFTRNENNLGAWEATPVYFDMDAAPGTLAVHENGNVYSAGKICDSTGCIGDTKPLIHFAQVGLACGSGGSWGATASCPAGYSVIGGGFEFTQNCNTTWDMHRMISNGPNSSRTGWYTGVYGYGGVVRAICMKN